MAEPRPKSGPLQIHVSYSFDRLLESKLAQAYDILVPSRERPVGGRVKEVDNEGYSGAILERPGLERVRDLAAEGQIQVVLAYAPDRLSRKYAYQILLIEEFARH